MGTYLSVNAEIAALHIQVITCFEVIEHILSPIEFIAEMQQYLKPGGMMIMAFIHAMGAFCFGNAGGFQET